MPDEINLATAAEAVATLLKEIKDIKVVDHATEAQASAMLVIVRKRWKALDEDRKSVNAPHKTRIDENNDAYGKLIDPLKEQDRRLAAAMSGFAEFEQLKLREAEKREGEALRLAQSVPAEDLPVAKEIVAEAKNEVNDIRFAAPKVIESAAGATNYTTDWEIRVEDEGKLPREYTVPDLAKIKKAVRAAKGELKIPGVLAWEVRRPVVRRNAV